MKTEDREITENNEIIDHVEAIRKLVERKCSRCKADGEADSCMGCIFNSADLDIVPACLDRILYWMHGLPNTRDDIVAAASKRDEERVGCCQRL